MDFVNNEVFVKKQTKKRVEDLPCIMSELQIYTSSVSNDQQWFNHESLQADLPIFISPVLYIFRWIAVSLGLPIHLLVAFVILRTRQLHSPRNAFWLGIITCHFSTLMMAFLEYFIEVRHWRYFVACRTYILLVDSPYTNLLVNLLMATADRWIAISYPILHRRRITVVGVVMFIITSWILVLLTQTSPYWLGEIQFPVCSVEVSVMKWVTFSHIILVGLITVAQVLVCVRTRHYLRFKALLPATNTVLKPDEHFVHLPDKTISRLELEASITLVSGVVPLFFFTLPLAFVFLAIIFCKMNPWQCDDSTFTVLIPYVRELHLLHAVISPLIYILRSSEFSKALRRIIPRSFSQRKRDRIITLGQF